jgi:diguanylate cyclase (GGDEF)-like protein
MDPEIGKLLGSADQLPGAPGVALRVVELNQREDVDISALVEVLGQDPVLAAKLLRTANSGMFGLPREVASVRQAVMVLGLRTVNLLALSFSAVAVSTGSSPESFDYRGYWTQCMATALGARKIAERRLPGLKDEAFLAGMLADIGRLLLAERFPERYAPICERLAESSEPVEEIEQRTLGATHMQVGRALLESWHLPELVCLAVAAHHDSGSLRSSAGENAWRLAQVVELASAIGELFGGLDLPARVARVERLSREAFGMSWDATEQLMAAIGDQIPAACAAFEVQSADAPGIALIRSRATELMLRESLKLQQQVVTVRSQVSQLEARAGQLEVEARSDALTGLHNRGSFDAALAAEVERARASGASFGLLLVDLDHFKRVNDSHGHPVGDELLRATAGAIRAQAGGAVACRYGGEEFALICPEDAKAPLRQRAERVRQAIEALRVEVPRGPLRATASVGGCWIAAAGPGLEAKDVIACADAELYRAKREGRNRCCVAILK